MSSKHHHCHPETAENLLFIEFGGVETRWYESFANRAPTKTKPPQEQPSGGFE
jgi:hypothetical protein